MMRVLVSLVPCLILLGCFESGPLNDRRPVVATVSGAPIYVDEFRAELGRLVPDELDGLPNLEGERAQRQALLNNLIERTLLLNEAEDHHVVVGMDEVDALYQRTRHGWRDLNSAADCDECAFESSLRDKDLTLAELKRKLRSQIMIRKYFKEYVFSRIAVTDQEIDEYLEKNPSLRLAPEQVRALQIVVKTEDTANELLKELRRGTPFEDLAMKHSLSPEGRNGGDLGYFSRGQMPAVFDEVCFAMRPGQISKVVASGYGYHIFKVVDYLPPGERPMAQLREEVEALLRRNKERQAQRDKTEQLKKAAEIVIHDKVLADIR